MLTILDRIPPGLPDLTPDRLHELLPGPTLIHLPGADPRPVFTSVLLHGNETTGWLAIRELLREWESGPQPRAWSLLIGNVAAARHGLRRLEGQTDYNRVWCQGETPEHRMAARVLEEMRARRTLVSIDIHNNTARNPHYACVQRLDGATLHLAKRFSSVVVFFLIPNTVQSSAFSDLCPAITLECGQVGDRLGVLEARELVRFCLSMTELPHETTPPAEIQLFHTVATMKIPDGWSFGFGSNSGDLAFSANLDRMNFQCLPAGTEFGQFKNNGTWPLEVVDELGDVVFERYFRIDGSRLLTRRAFTPAMLTQNEQIVRQDCLGYVMEPMKRLPVVQKARDVRGKGERI